MPRHFHVHAHRPATGVLIMCGVVAGTALQLQQAALWSRSAYVVLLVLAMLLAAAICTIAASSQSGNSGKSGKSEESCSHVRAGALLALGVLAGFALAGWRASLMDAQRMPPAWEAKDVRISARITHMPQPTERGVRLRVLVERAWSPQPPHKAVRLPRQVALTWYGSLPPQGLRAGQRWEWTVRLKAPHGERNPHAMDWELWQWSQGIQATGYIRQGKGDAPAHWLAQTSASPVAQWRGHLHEAIQAPVGAGARMQASVGVVQALVTGAQSSITQPDWQLFRDTGISHLVSISGLHITMFAWLAIAVVNALWRRSMRCCLWMPAPVAAAWAGWCLAAAYAVFSGWGIPAQRTIGMLLIVVLLRSSGRSWPWPYVWLVVLTAVVVVVPWSLLQAGFWLSFVAVGVLFATQLQAQWASQSQSQSQDSVPDQKSPRKGLGAAARQLLQEQWTVGVALAPLTLVLFGQVSVVGMLANLWAIPWMTLVITPLSMLGVLYAPLWTLAAHGVSVMVWVLNWMSSWPMAVWHFAQPPWWAACAGLLGCLWLVMPWGWRWQALGVPAMLPMLWWTAPAPAWGHIDMLALDVGQGSAILLRTRTHSLLFDAGPRWSAHTNAGDRTVVPLLRALGVQPTAMMISHADSDHAGGAYAVQQAYPGMQWLGAGGKQPCLRGQSWQWDGVQFDVLHPSDAEQRLVTSSNAASCVLRVQAANGQRVLLTGDIGAEQERALLRKGTDVRAQVIVVPHHGSTSSSSADFVAQVRPRFAVVQAGYLNRYGHPAPSVVQRYLAQEAVVVDTPSCGAARWRSVKPETMQCERAIARRYWANVGR